MHVEHAGRHAGALRQFGHGQRRQRRLLGRLDHHRAAGGQRRRHLARDHRDREVPRRDRRAHADRLLDDEVALVVVGGRDGLAVDALGLLGEPLDEAGAVADLALGLGQRLALLGGHDARQVVGMLVQQVEPLHQDRAALLGGLGAPGRPGLVGGRDARPAVSAAPRLATSASFSAGGRVGDGEAGAAGDPLAVDQRVGLQQGGVGQGGQRREFSCPWCRPPSVAQRDAGSDGCRQAMGDAPL